MKEHSKPFIYKGKNSLNNFKQFIKDRDYSAIVILVDENTQEYCLPLLKNYLDKFIVLVINSGEENKTINSCIEIWEKLSNLNIDRNALVINLGGGVICDMGGFIAATYKRGIDFVHIPTTLLAMCDASIGGKLGVNIKGIKNQIGVFKNPKAIIIYTEFLKTLPERQITSGLAEIVKHSLIGDSNYFKEIYEFTDFKMGIAKLIDHSIKIKTRIVNLDIYEKGIRKSLNFGHSIGHALESFFLINHPEHPIYHGEAVAAGMIAESWLSYNKNFINQIELDQITSLMLGVFPRIKFCKKDFEEIVEYIKKDKKNENHIMIFTLLNGIGQSRINEVVSKEEIFKSLDFYLNL